MNIAVGFKGMTHSRSLHECIDRRLQSELSRFGREVTSVVVRMEDLNGPKGGVDMLCRITVRSLHAGVCVASQTHHDPYLAADRSIDQIAQTLSRRLDRFRSSRRLGGMVPVGLRGAL